MPFSFLRSITRSVFGASNDNRRHVLEDGSLVRITGKIEQTIYLSCNLSIEPVSNDADFSYYLLCTNLDSHDGSLLENQFRCLLEMVIGLTESDTERCVEWYDPNNSAVLYRFYYADTTTDEQLSQFIYEYYQCLYETSSQTSRSTAKNDALIHISQQNAKLAEFKRISQPITTPIKASANKKSAKPSLINIASPQKPIDYFEPFSIDYTHSVPDFKISTDFYAFNTQTNCYELVAENTCLEIHHATISKNRYFLCIFYNCKLYTHDVISPDCNLFFDLNNRFIIWNGMNTHNDRTTLGVKFSSFEDFGAAKIQLNKFLVLNICSQDLPKTSTDDMDYLIMSINSMSLHSSNQTKKFASDTNSDEEDEAEQFTESDDNDCDEDDDKSDNETKYKRTIRGGIYNRIGRNTNKVSRVLNGNKFENKISNLCVGKSRNLTIISQGNKLGFFNTDNDKLHHQGVGTIKKHNGTTFEPSKIMLHNNEANLLLLDSNNPSSIYRYDIDRGSIVDEWKTESEVPLFNIAPTTKNDAYDESNNIVAINSNNIMVLDPRANQHKMCVMQDNSYAKDVKFRSLATTPQGHLVVGSSNGELRMYTNNKYDKRAKTLLSGFGQEIIGVDISKDGKYILATCSIYLMVIDVEFTDPQTGNTKLGYEAPMGKYKSAPKFLRLRPEHQSFITDSNAKFTVAKFNDSDPESLIVTSLQNYTIIWDFKKIMANILDVYSIKALSETIVQDSFTNNSSSVIVATAQDLSVAKKSTFSIPKKGYYHQH